MMKRVETKNCEIRSVLIFMFVFVITDEWKKKKINDLNPSFLDFQRMAKLEGLY
jgi:hypothetical protein